MDNTFLFYYFTKLVVFKCFYGDSCVCLLFCVCSVQQCTVVGTVDSDQGAGLLKDATRQGKH